MARSAGLQSDGIFENVDGKIFGPCLLRGNYSFIFISSKRSRLKIKNLRRFFYSYFFGKMLLKKYFQTFLSLCPFSDI